MVTMKHWSVAVVAGAGLLVGGCAASVEDTASSAQGIGEDPSHEGQPPTGGEQGEFDQRPGDVGEFGEQPGEYGEQPGEVGEYGEQPGEVGEYGEQPGETGEYGEQPGELDRHGRRIPGQRTPIGVPGQPPGAFVPGQQIPGRTFGGPFFPGRGPGQMLPGVPGQLLPGQITPYYQGYGGGVQGVPMCGGLVGVPQAAFGYPGIGVGGPEQLCAPYDQACLEQLEAEGAQIPEQPFGPQERPHQTGD